MSGKQTAVDPANPWLGLASFTEETRAYFFGREEEVAELGRRVQRKLLTILFGQSGLGKTSILRAGLVPQLRPAGYCPVYVRLDYSAEAPSASEQIKQAVSQASEAAGLWSKPGAARPGESLWEFFHHRGDALRDSSGRPLISILIFDQFEEIFTLAQTDDAGRDRTRAFIADLADLVENRASRAIEDDESSAERFDFSRADYRILISLREDYLAHLEGLKAQMPSVTQNRLRLARMSGVQALEAVVRPGAGLVTEEVAGQIVRFVSGTRELAAAEVEPSLLSLVCRELNEVRLAKGEAEISASLLAGSRETILAEFYERSIGDQPPGVRHFVEDRLLTDSGFRESLAEERVQAAFAAAGGPASLRTLVDRRLLRIEERLDVRRVELTHDVLCGVVRTSRDARREREAAEAAERRAAETEARESATRRSLRRARAIATGCALLAAAAVGSATFGYVNMRRARQAQAAESAALQRMGVAELAARRTAYDSIMSLAERALEESNLGRAQDLLDSQRPRPGQEDLRGWEWRYLWQQTRSGATATLCQESAEILSLAASADGRWLAVTDFQDGLSVWDLRTNREMATPAKNIPGSAAVFSPVAPLLAFATSVQIELGSAGTRLTMLHLWNAETRKMEAEFPLSSDCPYLAFSADGRTLLTAEEGGETGALVLRRVPEGTELARYPWHETTPAIGTPVAATPDLTRAVCALPNQRFAVVDVHTGTELWTRPLSSGRFPAVAISPDGMIVATTAGDAQICLWDGATGRQIGTLDGHTAYVANLLFWPDGKRLASAGTDQTIRIWDLGSRTCTDVLRGHRSEVWRLGLLADKNTLVSGCKDGTVFLWDTSRAHTRADHIDFPGEIGAWRFAPDSRSILTWGLDGKVARWSGENFQRQETLLRTGGWTGRGFKNFYYPSRFSEDGRLLAIGTSDGSISIWDIDRRVLQWKFKAAAAGYVQPLRFFAGASRLLVWSEADNRTHEVDLAANREIQSWSAFFQEGDGLSPDEKLFVEPEHRAASSIRDLPGRRSLPLNIDARERNAASFSPDGKHFAVASAFGYVRVWDTATWHEEATMRDFLNAATSASFSPDGKRLVSSGTRPDETVKLWDADGWGEVLILRGKGSVFGSHTAFSPDGNCIATRSLDNNLQLWRAPSWAGIDAAEKSAAQSQP